MTRDQINLKLVINLHLKASSGFWFSIKALSASAEPINLPYVVIQLKSSQITILVQLVFCFVNLSVVVR